MAEQVQKAIEGFFFAASSKHSYALAIIQKGNMTTSPSSKDITGSDMRN